jgi:hypothetical protein
MMGFFLFATVSRPALGATQSPTQWVVGALTLGVKWPWHKADHSTLSSAKVKDVWSYTSALAVHFHGKGKGKVVPVL